MCEGEVVASIQSLLSCVPFCQQHQNITPTKNCYMKFTVPRYLMNIATTFFPAAGDISFVMKIISLGAFSESSCDGIMWGER